MGHGARRLRLLDDLLPKQRKCRIVWDGTVINNARVIKNELSRYWTGNRGMDEEGGEGGGGLTAVDRLLINCLTLNWFESIRNCTHTHTHFIRDIIHQPLDT